MENNGGDAGDDQGSGWLQVKKKHRSSSKFSLQGWVGGFSGKQATSVPRSQAQAYVKTGNSHGKHVVGQRGKIPVHNQGGTASASNISKEEVVVQYLDKRVVCQNESDLKIAARCDSKDCVFEVLQRDKLATSGKSKWGDLDTEASVPHQEKIAGADIKFGDIDNDYSVSGKAEDASSSISCIASSVETKGEILMVTSIDVGQNVQEPLSLSTSDRHKVEEVKELSSEDVKILITNEKLVISTSNASSCGVKCYEQIESVEIPLDASSLSGSAPNELDRAIAEATGPMIVSEGVEPEMLDIAVTEVGPDTLPGGQDAVSQLHRKSALERTEEPESIKDSGPQQTTQILDSSNPQTIGCTDAGDEDESKERFRERLWCFLFDNLNRAVDELYLLCELECDVEQMKEADLVLEEAASDFKELKARVEEFENVKKSTSQSIDGPPMALMSDHRRPHALSWEVRRMTTSPHRAEILSSSLEAFRKIQQERGTQGVGDAKKSELDIPTCHHTPSDSTVKISGRRSLTPNTKETLATFRKPGAVGATRSSSSRDKRNSDLGRSRRIILTQNSHSLQNPSSSCTNLSSSTVQDCSAVSVPGKSKRDLITSSETDKGLRNKNKMVGESGVDKNLKSVDHLKKASAPCENDMDKRNGQSWKSMDAWKEKRNWEDILATPCRASSRFLHSPGVSRRSAERARVLHDKLLSPEKKKKTSVDLKKEAEEKHARAMRIRNELENERMQKLQRNSEKVNRVNEWQAVRNMKLREGMYARHQRSESRHEAFLAQVARRAGDESSKVNEVRFITSLTEENKKLILRQKLHDSELRRAEKLLLIKTKQKEDTAREEAVLERKKLIEAEKLQRLAEIQRKKEEALVRREEERKASSAAREAKAMEQLRRKEVRVKAQQEEAELLAQKLAERLRESEQRRKFYLEQIRERASMDFRDQSSPLLRRPMNKECQGRSTPTSNGEECEVSTLNSSGDSLIQTGNVTLQPLLKRRIKKIRQRLMTSKYEFVEPPVGVENSGIGYRSALGTARAKVGRWLQELQRLRQARKEGASSIGLITAEMIKFMEGKDPELQASRQAGLLDFIASALPASQTSKPEACQFTIYLLRLLRVVLSAPVNKSYFIAQNLLPPIIPMLAAAVENYIKIAAASNVPGGSSMLSVKTCVEGLEPTSEALDGFLWTVATIIGHVSSDERQLQMQDGLQELLLAYQVIHRLRDLFALHDRPQVEGLPFPSSILLSINLLVVLTSRSRTHSSIDWESFPQTILEDNTFRDKVVETADLGHSPIINSSGDSIPQLCALIGSIPVSLPDVPEDRPLDVSCTIKSSAELTLLDKYSNKLEVVGTSSHISDILDEPDLVSTDKHAVSTFSQKEEKSSVDVVEQNSNSKLPLKTPVKFLLSAISETGLVCLPSLLTAVLLQANNRLSSEQGSHVLPSNFEEVATGVLKVFNNLALIDIGFMQQILARPDLKMEFFHLMSFLLSYCTSKWGVATDQVGLLLLESLSLLGYFALLQPGNQAVLRWGKSPTILHKICDLPFVFFSDPDLMPVLAGTLVAACYGCEQNKGVVQLELSTDMLLSLLRSCRNGLSSAPAGPISTNDNNNNLPSNFPSDSAPVKPNRSSVRGSSRVSSGKSSSSGNSSRISKVKTHKDNNKISRPSEEAMPVKQNQPILENSYSFMLHSRFTESFIDRAEQFFAA